MNETLVSIPGATAHHVLGQSSVTLGAGDLNLLPAPAGSKHDLMLTVGSAGFSLHHDTPFGTLEGDPRAYVFSPEIEGVQGGFVKIALPAGVEEDGSRLSALQTKFEQVLIAHGLLQPGGPGGDASTGEGEGEGEGEEGAGGHHRAAQHVRDAFALGTEESLVEIPRCIAAQLLGEEIAILSEGTLSLQLVVVAPESESEKEEEPVLALTVGKSAFPLYKDTLFGTLANDSRTYVFKPVSVSVSVSEGTSQGFVAIVLPEAEPDAPSDLTPLQNELELVLVEHGLLKAGLGAAAADEVARSLREDGTRTAQRIRDVSVSASATASAKLSTVANNVSRGAEGGMRAFKLADVAHGVGGAVLGVTALVAGAVVTTALAPSDSESDSDSDSETESTLAGRPEADSDAPTQGAVAMQPSGVAAPSPALSRPSSKQNEEPELRVCDKEVGGSPGLDSASVSDQGYHAQDGKVPVDTRML